ncbi:10808_t:CDS:2 [Scutellospora calospora]|uniref:10808_t:CDS:1 n=1 Tax=Scutellospora calospora TaxID=85575 RepID=A0ACA9LGM4_9GLOM|nr:10808_t:CDS:2 [Scutellospora calospora]
MNAFCAYLMNLVKNWLVEKNTNFVVILSSCISRLQPLNIAINKASNLKDLWDNVNTDFIRRLFKCCRISTEIDSSENHILFDYDNLLEQDEVNNNLGNSKYNDSKYSDSEYSDHYIEDNEYRNE